MPEVRQLSMKMVLLGDPSVGKTSVSRKFVYNMFDDKYLSTLGTKITKKEITYEKLFKDTIIKLTLLIWDVMGQKDFKRFHKVAYTGCRGGIIVCDISRTETIKNLDYWLESLKDSAGDIPILILGNKVDLAPAHNQSLDLFKKVTENYKIPSFLTSAKTGENIETAFYLIGKKILKNDLMKEGY